MSKIIKLKKGLDIRLVGEAEKKITRLPMAESFGVSPSDFVGVTPKMLVKAGDKVKAGSALFFDKSRPDVLFTSPVSGTVSAVNRGEKRKILDIVVETDKKQTYEEFVIGSLEKSTRHEVTSVLLKSGLWALILQRPYGVIADPADTPKAIFISGFDSAPLAPDLGFALEERETDLAKGVEVLKKLADGKVRLGLKADTQTVFNKIKDAEHYFFSGPHPAGNVGVQIHHIDPINKGDIVWTVDAQNVALIGRLFNTGKLDMTRIYAVTGSEIIEPHYIETLAGTPLVEILKGNVRRQNSGDSVRIINGNVLTGSKADAGGYIPYNVNQLTVIPEGDKYEFVGWAKPRLNKFSVSRAYFSWLTPKKKYDLDTNLNGGHRPFVLTGLFERYLPMDIYPLYLIKAILAGDIDKMENLGIYEIVEEDLALCEFVDPSKNNIQQMVRDGINLMIKELS